MQAYSNPKKASDPYALPDLSILEERVWDVNCQCGDYLIPWPSDLAHTIDPDTGEEVTACRCPSCSKLAPAKPDGPNGGRIGYFWSYCFPGCLPDSDWYGPFETAEEALADARSMSDCDDEIEEEE